MAHQERVRHAMIKYANGDSYWSCIHEPFEPYYQKMLKRHGLRVEEAVAMSDWSLKEAKDIKDDFCSKVLNEENQETLKILRQAQEEIMRISVMEELKK